MKTQSIDLNVIQSGVHAFPLKLNSEASPARVIAEVQA